jgi:hypothetical protein
MDLLTEALNIVKCPPSISTTEKKVNFYSKKQYTHVFGTVSLIQCHRHV